MKSSPSHNNSKRDALGGDSRHQPLIEQNDTVVAGKSSPERFRLFDLSVFGIYDEETYAQLNQVNKALYPGLSSNGSKGGQLQSGLNGKETASNELHHDFHPQVEGGSGEDVHKNNIKEVLVPTHSIDDESANARYGGILAERNSIPSSIEFSLSDWQSQQVVKPSQNALDVAGGLPIHVASLDTEDFADSSWDDEDDGGTTQSTSTKEVSKFQGEPTSPGVMSSSHGRSSLEELAFPLRTTAMQKFLQKRNTAQESIVETQEVSELYEAPYVEHYSPPWGRISQQDVDQEMAAYNDVSSVARVGSGGLVARSEAKEALDMEGREFETQYGRTGDSHPKLAPSLIAGAMFRTSLLRDSEAPPDVQPVLREDIWSNKAELVKGVKVVNQMDQMGIPISLKAADARVNDVGNLPEKPVSLRWKGKAGSTSTQSLSSMEDEASYATESNTASGSERDYILKQEAGSSTEGLLSFKNKESKIGSSGERVRSHYQPVTGVSRRTRVSNVGFDGQKHGSGEIGASPQSARTRASNQRFVNADAASEQGRAAHAWNGPLGVMDSGGKPVGWRGSQASNVNKNSFDKDLSHPNGGPHGYNSDWSFESNERMSHLHSNYSERHLLDPYGLSLASSGSYLFQPPPHGTAPIQKHGLTHSCLHGVSPACSLCAQQQFILQQPPIVHQNLMVHSYPAHVFHSTEVVYESAHHDMRPHHMDASTYLNPLLRLNKPPMGNIFNSNHTLPVASLQKSKLYPPLPGKGAAPFVICKHCDQIVQVPAHLPHTTGSIQKLQCGACHKFCKYSIHHIGATAASFMVDALYMHKVTGRNDLDVDTRSMHSSSFDPGYGVSASTQNVYELARRTSDRVYPEDCFKTSGKSPNPQKLARRQAGAVPEQGRGRSQAGHGGEDDRLYDNSGTKSEGTLSSSHSSTSGSSPVRYTQVTHTMYEEERSRPSLEAASGSTRSPIKHTQKAPMALGPPLIEHFADDDLDFGFGNGSRSAPWSPSPGSPLLDSFMSADFDERLHDRGRAGQDLNNKPKFFASLLKRSIGKQGHGGTKGRTVWVNGHLIMETAVRRAEELAGPIHPGSYWYDYQAGFWGAMRGPCLGIAVPCIEEFNFPLTRDCAGGKTGILVNGRELHEKDLEVLVKRGLPTTSGNAYILDISGILIDDVTGRPLKNLGKLAPSIERRGRGFGMSMTQMAAQT